MTVRNKSFSMLYRKVFVITNFLYQLCHAIFLMEMLH